MLLAEHKSDKPFVFVVDKDKIEVRLRILKISNIKDVIINYNDPYNYDDGKWQTVSKKMDYLFSDDYYDWFVTTLEVSTRRFCYFFEMEYEGKTKYLTETGLDDFWLTKYAFNLPFSHESEIFTYPEWINETVWYQIFPDRFNRSNEMTYKLKWHRGDVNNYEIYGGNIAGIIEKLDYLKDLGVNGIYFTPLFKADTSHKYDTVDYFQIDESFGTEKDFKLLIDEAHNRGIKIMLDGVFNHMSTENEIFQDVVKNKQDSKYVDWFYVHDFDNLEDYKNHDHHSFREKKYYDAFAYSVNMPKIRTANVEAKNYIFEAVRKWTELGIDGWRLDVANEVDHLFWKDFKRLVTNINPDIYILGEIWHDSETWLRGDEFHAVMNYKYTNAMVDYFASKDISSETFKQRMYKSIMQYETNVHRATFNLIDSHDTTRISNICNHDFDIQKLIHTFMFMQMGSSCIYYGTEIGMEGEGDPLNRKLMIWEKEYQKQEYFEFYQKIIAIKKTYSDVLTYGSYNLEIKDELLVLTRTLNNITITLVVNNTDNDIKYQTSKDLLLRNKYDNETLVSHGLILFVS